MLGGNRERYCQRLNKFIAQQGSDVTKALCRFYSGNHEGRLTLTHDLVGVAKLMQAPELSRLAAFVEFAILDGKALTTRRSI